MFEALVGFLVRRRAWVLAVAALITAAAAFLAVRIQFDFSPQAVLEGDDDLVRRCEQYKAAFGSSDSVVLVVVEATGKADALSAEALTWQVRAGRRLAGLAMVRQVESLTDLKMPALSPGPPWVKLSEVVTAVPVGAADEARLRQAVDKLPLLAVGVGLAWTIAGIVLAGESLNIVSNVLPVLLFIIGMANCVHIVNRYAQDAATPDAPAPGPGAGAARRDAARSTMTHMAMACLLTSATTAIGFGSLLGARSTVLKVLGWQAMLGMAMLYVSSMVLFSVMLGWFRPPATSGRAGKPGLTARMVAASGHAIARHPWPAMLGSLALIAACLLLARNMVINSYMTETYDENSPTMRTLRLVENRLSGILPLGVSLQADKAETLLEPETFRKVADLQKFAEKNDQVLLARSYVDLHRQVLALLAGQGGRDLPMPPPGQAGRTQIQLSGTILRALGASSGYGAFVSPDGRHARILLRLRDAGTRRELELIRDLEARLAEAFPPGCGIEARLTDDVYLHARAMDRFVRDLLWSLAGASVIIFGVIALLFWSVRLGVAAILPNVTPLLMTLGYMGIRGYEMNAGNVIVFAISLGIAVDGTIHFLARFREEIKARGGAAQAIYRSYISTGRAIVLTCLLIVAGLSVLLLSEFLPSRHFAELTGVTMLGALVGDLFLLPACLMLMWKRRAG